MKIIIIGSQGMLGQELARVYQNENPLLWSKSHIDISNKNDVDKKINEVKPDIVFNAAAYNDVDAAEKNKDIAYAINAEGPGHLARAVCAAEGILVHYSTDYIFNGDEKRGYSEEDDPEPRSVYGKSKLLGEKNVIKYSDKYYIIRLSRLFGKSGIGGSAKTSFVDLMLGLAEKSEVIDAVDEELSNPTYAPDLAEQSREIVEGKFPFGIYHVSNRGACTWYEFTKEIFDIKGINVKLNAVAGSYFPRPAPRPKYSILLNTKLNPMRPWQAALKEYLLSK